MGISADALESNPDVLNSKVQKEERAEKGGTSEHQKKHRPHEADNEEKEKWNNDKGNGKSLQKDSRGI
jgi:hypothetical protein